MHTDQLPGARAVILAWRVKTAGQAEGVGWAFHGATALAQRHCLSVVCLVLAQGTAFLLRSRCGDCLRHCRCHRDVPGEACPTGGESRNAS